MQSTVSSFLHIQSTTRSVLANQPTAGSVMSIWFSACKVLTPTPPSVNGRNLELICNTISACVLLHNLIIRRFDFQPDIVSPAVEELIQRFTVDNPPTAEQPDEEEEAHYNKKEAL